MTLPFVPMMPGLAEPPEASSVVRLKPVAHSSTPFQPTCPAAPAPEAIQPETAPAPPEAPPVHVPEPPHGDPKITIERQGETITHIRIQCGCGQVMELKCEY